MIGRILAWPFIVAGMILLFIGFLFCGQKDESMEQWVKRNLLDYE